MGARTSLQKKELSVLVTIDDEEENLIVEDECVGEGQEIVAPIITEVSLNSVVGLTSPKTMKLKGVIKGEEVILMVDPGGTHNFISTITVQKLEILVAKSKEFEVAQGNGEAV